MFKSILSFLFISILMLGPSKIFMERQSPLYLETHGNSIWIEGEDAQKKAVITHSWYRDADSQLLSGGEWISHFGEKEGQVSYTFDSLDRASYRLWMRVNLKEAIVQYRINDADWQRITNTETAYDYVNVAADQSPDYRFLAWINVGDFELEAGRNTLAIKFTSEKSNHGALDCVCFTQDLNYWPEKKFKPGQERPKYTVPVVGEDNFEQWMTFIEPTERELRWRSGMRWHTSLATAAAEAKQLNRPILLWAMNGHPSGET